MYRIKSRSAVCITRGYVCMSVVYSLSNTLICNCMYFLHGLHIISKSKYRLIFYIYWMVRIPHKFQVCVLFLTDEPYLSQMCDLNYNSSYHSNPYSVALTTLAINISRVLWCICISGLHWWSWSRSLLLII